MRVVKLFVKSNCSRCPAAKQVGEDLKREGVTVVEYDVETADGLAEASFHSIQATPSFIVEDNDENTIADFRGDVPTVQAIRDIITPD